MGRTAKSQAKAKAPKKPAVKAQKRTAVKPQYKSKLISKVKSIKSTNNQSLQDASFKLQMDEYYLNNQQLRNINDGLGYRQFKKQIFFKQPFTYVPQVVISINSFETNSDTNPEFFCLVKRSKQELTKEKFTFVIGVDGNSAINYAGITWIAKGI